VVCEFGILEEGGSSIAGQGKNNLVSSKSALVSSDSPSIGRSYN
jgi:hypothetical protein